MELKRSSGKPKMSDEQLIGDYFNHRDNVLRECEVTGDTQRAVFFRMFGELAADNGDCADLVYAPIRRDGARPYRVDGYAFDKDSGELHLGVCDMRGGIELETINADGVDRSFARLSRFCEKVENGFDLRDMEETSAEFELVHYLKENRKHISRVRCILFTDCKLSTRRKTLKSKPVFGVETTRNVIDFIRYVDILQSKGGVEPIALDLLEVNGGKGLPCLAAHGVKQTYESYLTVMPGTLLAKIYGLYGARLMEQNVRTFLQARTKANKGIIKTATDEPEMFFAFNNGITATASSIEIETASDGAGVITKLGNLQIVNGGQTTASLLYAADRGQADLSSVFVQMKLSIVKAEEIEELVPRISRYSNTQNKVSEADFFSSHPFHIELQKLSRKVQVPVAGGALSTTRWFYERARGQYRNEGYMRSPSERTRFEAMFPKNQVLVKTDLAKYQLTFRTKPHVVSQGAQKAFLAYADEISHLWESSPTSVNELFFKETVAKAIVFRAVDRMVGRADWYREDRGYKANIVTYTIAKFLYDLKNSREAELDLDLIWRTQSVSEDIMKALDSLAQKIKAILRSPPPGITNVSEYAKKQGCWATIRAKDILDISALEDGLVMQGTARDLKSDARKAKELDNDIALDTWLISNIAKLDLIMREGQSRRLMSPKAHSAIQSLKRGRVSLGPSQKSAMKALLYKLKDAGIDIGF